MQTNDMQQRKRKQMNDVPCHFKEERDSLINDIKELRKYKHMYQALVEHIRVKAEANPSEWRYISLVYFKDDLEEDYR